MPWWTTPSGGLPSSWLLRLLPEHGNGPPPITSEAGVPNDTGSVAAAPKKDQHQLFSDAINVKSYYYYYYYYYYLSARRLAGNCILAHSIIRED